MRSLTGAVFSAAILAASAGTSHAGPALQQSGEPGREVEASIQRIQQEVRDVVDLLQREDEHWSCLMPMTSLGFPDEGPWVINSAEALAALATPGNVGACRGFTPPALDFSRLTVVGALSTAGGCTFETSRRVYRDDGAKTVTYLIETKTEGDCEVMRQSMNWIAVPKIPEDYKLSVEVSPY